MHDPDGVHVLPGFVGGVVGREDAPRPGGEEVLVAVISPCREARRHEKRTLRNVMCGLSMVSSARVRGNGPSKPCPKQDQHVDPPATDPVCALTFVLDMNVLFVISNSNNFSNSFSTSSGMSSSTSGRTRASTSVSSLVKPWKSVRYAIRSSSDVRSASTSIVCAPSAPAGYCAGPGGGGRCGERGQADSEPDDFMEDWLRVLESVLAMNDARLPGDFLSAGRLAPAENGEGRCMRRRWAC